MMSLNSGVRGGVGLLLVAMGAIPSVPFANGASPPDLSGIWRFNKSKSERLEDKLAELRPSMGGGRGGGMPGGGPSGGMGGGMRGGMGEGRRNLSTSLRHLAS